MEETFDEAAFCSTSVGERYFGHWLHDLLPTEILAGELSLPALAVAGTHRPNEPGYRELSGLCVRKITTAWVRRMWIFSDHELNRHRVRRIKELRHRIRSSVAAGGPERVFIGRGPSARGRSLANELEIAAALKSDGVAYIIPEQMEPAEIAWHLRDAKIVFGPEGSGHAHAICAMPSGSTLFPIMPPRQLNMIFRVYAEALGMRFAVDVGADIDEQRYVMPLDRIKRMLDLIDRATP